MASIKISELQAVGSNVGSELFYDSESFLTELNEQEALIGAGISRNYNVNINIISQISISNGISIATISAVTNVK
jgi:hypothetical protein